MTQKIFITKKEEAYVVHCGEAFFSCVIGRDGVTNDKHEGDWKTPAGEFRIKEVFYRADRVVPFLCTFPHRAITQESGWCDDPQAPDYNQFVSHPYPYSAENLWREDELYDVVAVLDYNMNPAMAGKGSAIFIHVAKDGMQYTKGCIAMKKSDLLKLLGHIGPETVVQIEGDM